MDYCNGGELSEALEKYQKKNGKPFPEELVQYIMRQIISAFKYIHGQGLMHRDIKLENILLNYENEEDKKDLNIMKAQVKIIDFGFACQIKKNSLTYTAIGNPLNMDPLILKKLNSRGKKARQLGYDQKADIWSLGAICYEMLIGKAAFDAEDMEDLVDKIETGIYKIPTTLSKEVVSFLNGMLQYDSRDRLNIEQLSVHQFLTKDVREFKSIDLQQVSNKLDKDELVIDVKKNTSIWAIFNKEDEDKLIGISPGHLMPIPENSEDGPQRNRSQEKKNNNLNNNEPDDDNPIRQTNTFQVKNTNMNNIMFQNNYNNRTANSYSGPFLLPAMQSIPGQFSQYPPMQNYYGPSLSTAPITESNYSFSGGIYK